MLILLKNKLTSRKGLPAFKKGPADGKTARSPLCNTQSVRITFVKTCGHQQVTLSSLFTVSRCICLRQDVPVPNGYETPKLQCVVVLLRCNSYAIQSSSVPGV